MSLSTYKNIKLTSKINEANCITHSGKFHVDDVMATIFLSKIYDKIVLMRVPSIEGKDTDGKLVYDIGLRKV